MILIRRRARESAQRANFGLALMVMLAVLVPGCDASCFGPTEGEPSFTMQAGPSPGTLTPGQTGTVELTIATQNGYDTPVNITSTNDPDITIDPLTGITTFNSKLLVTFHVRNSASIGAHTLHLEGAATSGNNRSSADYACPVSQPSSFSLSTTATELDLVPGGLTGSMGVTIARSNFAAAVQLSVTTDPAITATATTAVDGTSGVVTVTVPGTASGGGPWTVTVTGTSGSTARTATFIVRAVASVSVQLAPSITVQAGNHLPEVIHIKRYENVGIVVVKQNNFPAGISTTGGSSSGDDISLDINVSSLTTPGTYTVTFDVEPDFEGVGVLVSQQVIVTAAGSYTLSVQTAPFNIIAGAPITQDLVTVTRTNFAQTITVNATTQTTGLRARVLPADVTESSFNVSIAADDSVIGTRLVTLTSVVPNNPDKVTTFAVVVAAGPTKNTTYTFCPLTGTPAFFAVQDGGQTADWTSVTSSTSTYGFNITSGRGGIAYVVSQNGNYYTWIFYGTQAELAARGTSQCAFGGSVRTVTGSVANVGSAAQVDIGFGSQTGFSTPPNLAFGISSVEATTLDLVAASLDNSTPRNALRMLVRRDVPATSALGTLDFAGSESFTPATATLTLVNSANNNMTVNYQVHTANDPLATYAFSTFRTASFPLFGFPSTLLQAGDLHYVQATTGDDPNDVRTAGIMFGAVTNQTLALGGSLPLPTVTVLSTSPYVRLRAVLPVQAEYGKYFQAYFQQSTRQAITEMTSGYAGAATTVNLDIPDFTGMTNWLGIYGLAPAVNTQWYVTGSSWSTTAGTNFPTYTAGAKYFQAARRAVITP